MTSQGTPVSTSSLQTSVRRWRRPLAAAAVAATFATLSAVWGSSGVALAVPGPACGSAEGEAFANAFAAGGTYTLTDSLTVECSLILANGKTLNLDLGGNELTVIGDRASDGADASEPGGDGDGGGEIPFGGAGAGLTNSGVLLIADGTLTVTGGLGGSGGDGADGGENQSGGNGGYGTRGANGLVNYGTLVLRQANPTFTGGAGGDGGAGGAGGDIGDGQSAADGLLGDGGPGGFGVWNDGGTVATDTPLTLIAGGGGTGAGAVLDGGESQGLGTSVVLDGGGATDPASYTVYGSGSILTAAGKLAAAPVSWPQRKGYDFEGWFDEPDGGAQINSGASIGAFGTVYANWTTVASTTTATSASTTSGGAGGGGPVPTSTATTTTVPVTPTPVTTSIPASTTTSSTPISTSAIPTNNVKDPVTFTSSQAPSAPPLPGISSVNDTSASQFDVDTHTPTQGGDLTLVARGFKPGSVVDFWMHSTPTYLGSAIADVHGIAVLPVKLDKSLVGEHHVQSVGIGLLGESRNLAQPITIAAPPALASTGFPTVPITLIALLMISAGAALLTMRRRPQQGGDHR